MRIYLGCRWESAVIVIACGMVKLGASVKECFALITNGSVLSLVAEWRNPQPTTQPTPKMTTNKLPVIPQDKFSEHLKRAAAEVATWPLWKQNILKHSGEPMSETPREPVDNTRCQDCANWSAQFARQADELVAVKAELADSDARLDFLKSKGLTASIARHADSQPYLAYVIDPGSELDDGETIAANIMLESENKTLKSRLADVESTLPPSFYSDRDPVERFKFMVEQWRSVLNKIQAMEGGEYQAETLQAWTREPISISHPIANALFNVELGLTQQQAERAAEIVVERIGKALNAAGEE